MKSTVAPSPIKLSILLSSISKVLTESAITLPQNVNVDSGASLKTIILPGFTRVYPLEGSIPVL